MTNSVDYRPMMSSSDALIWGIEKDPKLQSTVMSVWLLDEAPTEDRMTANIDRMVAAIPRLRQRVVEGSPRPRWEELHDLEVDDHFERVSFGGTGGLDEALAFANDWVLEPFDRTRPLWRLGLLTDLADGKAAAIIKVHHSIADGMGMVLMLAAFTDFERHPARGATALAAPERQVFNPAKRLRHKAGTSLRRFATSPTGAGRRTVATLRSAIRLVTPHRTPHSQLMTDRSGEFHLTSRRLPLAAVKNVARESAVTLNDTFVTAMIDAVTAYHAASGVGCPRLRVHMPVNVRNERTANLAGNQFVPARVSLDLSEPAGRSRRKHIADQLLALQHEPALGHVNPISAAIQRLGKPISRFIIGGMMKGVDVLLSNVAGPPMPLYMAGGQVIEFYNFGPPAGAALNATLFSYDGSISIGFTIDTAAVSDVALFERCLDDVLTGTFSPSVLPT